MCLNITKDKDIYDNAKVNTPLNEEMLEGFTLRVIAK